MEPVGTFTAWTMKVIPKSAIMSVTTADSTYSRMILFLKVISADPRDPSPASALIYLANLRGESLGRLFWCRQVNILAHNVGLPNRFV